MCLKVSKTDSLLIKSILYRLRHLGVMFFLLVGWSALGQAQEWHGKLHAHNDYQQEIPFWNAYANGFESIEIDVLLKNDTLWVAHEEESITADRTLESLYLDPLEDAIAMKMGQYTRLQLLIDIKSEPYATLTKLEDVLAGYPSIVGVESDQEIAIVVSGNQPLPEDFINYSEYLQFDYQSLELLPDLLLDKVALVSLDFKDYSVWNGKGRMVDDELARVRRVIDQAHGMGKPLRFWATPDSKTAWETFCAVGVDFINTDHVYDAAQYVRSLKGTTHSAKGHSPIYTPTFKSDGGGRKIKSIILIIGDGMGLAQISAGMYGNGNQLSLTQLKNIGLLKTQSVDDFTTDSAAGGTAMATGEKTKNRFIGVDKNGEKLVNLPEYLARFDFRSGVITTDELNGATPAAFYAHQVDRGMTKEITQELAQSPLSLFVGAGQKHFERFGVVAALEKAGFQLVPSLQDIDGSQSSRVGYFAAIGELPTKVAGRENYLPMALDASLNYMEHFDQSFFLMVEGAFIDTGGHINRTDVIVEEMIDLDQTISKALEYADRDGETLVVITADHETGGFSLPQGDLSNNEVEGRFHSNDHTGIMVPVFAYGPHSDVFNGVYENTAIYHKIVELIQKYHR